MIITQENIEKLNVGDHPGARLCKGLLLDAIEAGDKLEARVNCPSCLKALRLLINSIKTQEVLNDKKETPL